MQFTFDNNRPIYIQLVEQLELYIISGRIPPGERLPSVRDLATIAKVNPNTMQKALQELEDKHLIITERTNGKFVADNTKYLHKSRDKLAESKIEKFFADMRELGFSYSELVHKLHNYKGKLK